MIQVKMSPHENFLVVSGYGACWREAKRSNQHPANFIANIRSTNSGPPAGVIFANRAFGVDLEK